MYSTVICQLIEKKSKEKLAKIGCITVIQISLFIISIDLVKTAGQVLKL